VKRDAKKDGSSDDDKDETAGQTLFTGEEVAAAGASLSGNGSPANGAPSRQEQSSVIGSLAGAFKKS
jgi:hypothetical protein